MEDKVELKVKNQTQYMEKPKKNEGSSPMGETNVDLGKRPGRPQIARCRRE